jgi:NADPH:quinone reductase-like Zn-dependent oxidoreductase
MSLTNSDNIQRVLSALPYAIVPIGLYGIYKFLSYCVPGPQHQSKLRLEDRTVLITGASSGLGRALAFVFYQKVRLK